MGLTAQNVIDAIRSRLTTDSTYLSDSDLLTFISQVYFEVYNTIIEVNEDFFGAANSTVYFAANTGTYALPDYVKIESVEVSYNGEDYFRAQQIERAQIPNLNDFTSFSSASEPKFDIFGNSATFFPTPTTADVALSANYRIFGIPSPVAISAVAQTFLIPTSYEYVMIDGVEAYAWDKLGMETNGDRAEKKFETGLNKIRQFAHGRDMSRLFGMSYQDEGYFRE